MSFCWYLVVVVGRIWVMGGRWCYNRLHNSPRQVFLPPEKEDKAEPLTVDHFVFAFGLYVIGIAASFILYFGETLGWLTRRNKTDSQTLFYKRKLATSSTVSLS